MPLATMVAGAWVVLIAGITILGADLMWVVALGDSIRAEGVAPAGLPFASAPQVEWHSPIAVAELLLSFVHGFGGAALAGLHVALVALTLLVLVAEGRRLGGGEVATALVISLAVVGASSALVVTRLPSLSLLPFVIAVAVMRRSHERPTRRVWWLVPLYILWGNLHGGVLVGLAVLMVFLVASPAAGPPGRRVGIGAGCSLALVLTSAGMNTPAYYLGVLGNEAAARGTELWARVDLRNPLDVAMVLVAAVLVALAARRRPPLWEQLVATGLVLGMLLAARNGVWLILFVAPAALRQQRHLAAAMPHRAWRGAVAGTVAVAVLGAGWQLGRRVEQVAPPGAAIVPAVQALSGDRPVLADEPLAETLAQAGVTIWASNPIDAFTRPVQGGYLDFLQEGRIPPAADVALVVVAASRAGLVAGQGWTPVADQDGFVILERTDQGVFAGSSG